MPHCHCFSLKPSQKEKEDVLKRLNVILLGRKLKVVLKPGHIIDNSEVFGPHDSFHKISVEKLGLWALKNYVKYENDDSEIRPKCYRILYDLSYLDGYICLKVQPFKSSTNSL